MPRGTVSAADFPEQAALVKLRYNKWFALPTARYFNPHLKLREPGNLQSSYVMVPPPTRGAWPPRKP